MQKQQTVKALLDQAVCALIDAGKEEHQVDAWWLMSEVTGMSRSQLQLDGRHELTASEEARFQSYMDERLAGKPLQYILGVQSFYGYDYRVNEHVLIPRFETEELVEKAVNWAKAKGSGTLMDMCTGSGCIGLTVLKECPGMTGILVDLSDKALALARINAASLKLTDRVKILQSDLFQQLEGEKVDMILSNPPYIVTDVIETLDTEVRSEEPYMALDGGADGLDFYRRIAAEAKNYLNDNGLLLFEIGYDQSEAVMSILQNEGYHNIEGYRDLSGKDRMVQGVR